MKKALIITLAAVSIMALAQDKGKKTPAKPVPVDSNSVWVSKADMVKLITQKREELRLQYVQQDAYLTGQMETYQRMSGDSVRVQK